MHFPSRQQTSLALYALTIIVAPSLLGSYYTPWRTPLLIIATLTAVVASLFSYKQSRKSTKVKDFNILLITTLSCTITILGSFMWFNTWGFFSTAKNTAEFYISWIIAPLDNQPFTELPGAPDKSECLDRLTYIIPALGILIASYLSIKTKLVRIEKIITLLFWTGVALASLGLLQKVTDASAILWQREFYKSSQPLFFATFRSPGIATSYLNLCLAAGLSHLLASCHLTLKKSKPNPAKPIFISLGLIILCAGSISAGSKAGAMFCLLTIILWAAFNLKTIIDLIRKSPQLLPSGSPHERNIIISVILIAFTLASLSLGSTLTKRWSHSENINFSSLQKRKIANQVQIEMIKDPQWSKVAGFGPGSFYPMFYYYKQGTELKATWVYAHNDYLQTLVEWGWVGASCFALLIAGGCYHSLKSSYSKKGRFKTADTLYFRGITLTMLICLMHATVDFPFQIESIAITFSILLGAAWAAPNLKIKDRKSKI